MPHSEFLKGTASFLLFFGLLSFSYYMVEGLETLGVLLFMCLGTTLAICVRSFVLPDKAVDYVLASQIGMIGALAVVFWSVVGLGGIINSTFVSFLTMPPVFFYLEKKVAEGYPPSGKRKAANAIGILLFLATVSMFHWDRIGLPISNPILNNFSWSEAPAILASSNYYKAQIFIFVFTIVIFIWNLPTVMGRVRWDLSLPPREIEGTDPDRRKP